MSTFYGTVAAADTYVLNDRIEDEGWNEYDSDTKTKGLKKATALIENLNFVGAKNDAAQVLEFPRGTDTTVPEAIELATYEIAYQLVVHGRDVELEAEQIGEVATSFGAGRLRKDPDMAQIAKAHLIPSAVAWRHLVPYLLPGDEVKLSRVS
jgi:hypothetical protein